MQDDDIDGNIYDASRGDALPEPLPPDADAKTETTDDLADDRLADQLGELFAVALADEPESRVTAQSVLREVRAHAPARRLAFSEWLHSSGWKWGGALAGAAALIGAVIVMSPVMGGSASDSAGSAATADMAESADSATGDEAGEMADTPEMAVSAQDRDDSAADGGAADSAAGAQAPAEEAAPSDGTAYDSMAAEEGGSAAEELPSGTAALPPLTDAEWSAATGALPRGLSFGHVTDGADIRSSTLRGATIGLPEPDGYIRIVVGPDTGPEADHPGDSDAAADDTVGSMAQRLRHAGLVTVQVADGTRRVAVAATEQALGTVSEADLTWIARAVLEAS